jgi:hypothetical protein
VAAAIRLKPAATKPAGETPALRPFLIMVGHRPMRNCFESSSGGTGFPACADRKGLMNDCFVKSLVAPVSYRYGVHRLKTCATNGGGRGRPPYLIFHALPVGQRRMNNYLPLFSRRPPVRIIFYERHVC